MKLSSFCGGIKPSCPNLKSRDAFIDGLFEAAGQKPYISKSYKCQLCNGSKAFIVGQKIPLRGKDNLSSLTEFFMGEIPDVLVPNVIAAFGIPEKDPPDKKALCGALAHQMRAMIDSDDEDVSDIVAVQYQNLKSAESDGESTTVPSVQPLYPGDSVYLRSKFRPVYTAGFDQIVEHTWQFDNAGTQAWTGRRLYLSNHNEIRARAESNYIDIPDTPPNKGVTISARIDTRSFEARSECQWVMVDNEGNNCFPNSHQFAFVIDVKFQIED